MAGTSAVLLSSLRFSVAALLLVLIAAQAEDTINDSESCAAIGKVYTKCYGHCQPTCDNLQPKCYKICKSGCACEEGTIDNGRGECVKLDKCSECSGNTTYTECGNKCSESCERVRNPTLACTEKCRSGCSCKDKYAVLEGTEKCVLHQDCPRSGDTY